jgi:hypothetical protein
MRTKAITRQELLEKRGDLSPFLIHLTRSGDLKLDRDNIHSLNMDAVVQIEFSQQPLTLANPSIRSQLNSTLSGSTGLLTRVRLHCNGGERESYQAGGLIAVRSFSGALILWDSESRANRQVAEREGLHRRNPESVRIIKSFVLSIN